LSFRPAPRVARDEQFDDGLFDRAAGERLPAEDEEAEPERPARPAREGLPPSYRMRHDPHYVDQIASRRHAEPVLLVPVGAIDGPHPVDAPRDLQPLAESIAKVGVLQPLLVRRQGGRYHLIAGTRRLAGAIAAGMTEVPCIVHVADEERARVLAEAEAVRGAPAGEPQAGTEARAPIPAAVFTDITEHLGAIGACLHLFGDRDRPLRERVAMELVQAEVQQAAWLVQALAVLASEPSLVPNTVDVEGLVRRLLDSSTPERVLAGVVIEHEPHPQPCLVTGDQQLIAVAVAGLLRSAHALVEKVEDARVSVRVFPEAGTRRVSVAVRQDLVRIPTAWRMRFFDMGWEDRPGGMSVGACLVAAQRVARMHGGAIHLGASERGCTLTLSLPAD
jgi:hypothetical protein